MHPSQMTEPRPPDVWFPKVFDEVDLLLQPLRIPDELNGWTAVVHGDWLDGDKARHVDAGVKWERMPIHPVMADELEWAIRGRVMAARSLTEKICRHYARQEDASAD